MSTVDTIIYSDDVSYEQDGSFETTAVSHVINNQTYASSSSHRIFNLSLFIILCFMILILIIFNCIYSKRNLVYSSTRTNCITLFFVFVKGFLKRISVRRQNSTGRQQANKIVLNSSEKSKFITIQSNKEVNI